MQPATSSWWSTGKNAPKSSDTEKNPDVHDKKGCWYPPGVRGYKTHTMRLCGCEQATWEAGMSIPGRPALQSPSFVPIRHWPFLFPMEQHGRAPLDGRGWDPI